MAYKNKYTEFLNSLIKKLTKLEMEFSDNDPDGRYNSIKDEKTAIKLIKRIYKEKPLKGYKIVEGKKRFWYDIAFENKKDENDIIPINIKISTLGTDNIDGKEGIFYALTGKNPTNFKTLTWESFMNSLKENLDPDVDASKDYYFFIFNKNKEKGQKCDCFWASLKTLKTLTTNPENLPFQTKWSDNRKPVKRNNKSAFKFIIEHLRDGHQKRINISETTIGSCNEILNTIKQK